MTLWRPQSSAESSSTNTYSVLRLSSIFCLDEQVTKNLFTIFKACFILMESSVYQYILPSWNWTLLLRSQSLQLVQLPGGLHHWPVWVSPRVRGVWAQTGGRGHSGVLWWHRWADHSNIKAFKMHTFLLLILCKHWQLTIKLIYVCIQWFDHIKSVHSKPQTL